MNYSNLPNICWFMKISTIFGSSTPLCVCQWIWPLDEILPSRGRFLDFLFFPLLFSQRAPQIQQILSWRDIFLWLWSFLFPFLSLQIRPCWQPEIFKEESTTEKCRIYHNIKMFKGIFTDFFLLSHGEGVPISPSKGLNCHSRNIFSRNSMPDRLRLIRICEYQ